MKKEGILHALVSRMSLWFEEVGYPYSPDDEVKTQRCK
jgi:hypothetical protein